MGPCPGRGAVCSPCETVRCRAGIATDAGVWDGPGSAKQREERCIAPGTQIDDHPSIDVTANHATPPQITAAPPITSAQAQRSPLVRVAVIFRKTRSLHAARRGAYGRIAADAGLQFFQVGKHVGLAAQFV